MGKVQRAAQAGGFPSPLFIHRASVEAGSEFFAKRAPDARAIADPDGALFLAFGLGRGSLWQLLGPPVWWRGLRALFRGNSIGRATGNVTQMPGAFLIRGREILREHRAKNAGDHPDLVAMLHAVDPAAALPAAQLAPKSTASPKKGSAKKLRAQHRKLLEQARELQRNGDLRGYAAMLERAEAVAIELDAAEAPNT